MRKKESRNGNKISVLIGLLLLVLFSCNKTNKVAPEGNDKIVLQIMSSIITETPEGVVEQAMADKYMELHPNIEIKFISTPSNEMNKQIFTRATGNNLPDAFMMFADFLPDAYSMGILLDIKQYLDADYFNGFLKPAVDQASVNGELVLFPWHIIPPGVMYRNDWFEEAGLSVPTNWDEFLEVAKAMTKDTNGDGVIDQWGFSMVGTNNGSGQSRFMHLARNFGVDDIKLVNGKWVSGLESPEYEKALKYFTELYTVHKVVPPGPTETGYPEAATYFATGKTGMMLTGSNGLGFILEQNPSLKGKIGSFNVPFGTRQVGILSISGYAVSAETEHPEEIIDYLKFMVNKENAAAFSEKTGRMPTRSESANSDFFSQTMYKGFVEAMESPYKIPNFPRFSELLNASGEAYTAIMSDTKSFADALRGVQNKSQEVVSEVNSNN